ncbi:hypothetical protein [Aridibaculum aurantiacum]|uniref:hypothetical protein n=1 Tax=Aridibaculum aurantiacum TaxID=2810307 RepID=UPI001A96566E|nr:hypothetical protein [Aridibaculum aurantiacum]
MTPKRIVFEGSKRSDELNLANIGNDTATYAISFVQIRMKHDGQFENITEPDSGQNFADKNLRIFPRTVTLAPNEAQTVKVQLIKANELAPGEYRSHLYFRALANDKPLGDPAIVTDSSVSVKLVPVFGISIPAIIRVGTSTSEIKMSDISLSILEDTIPVVGFTFHRTGNMSVYGDIVVEHFSPYGKTTRIAEAKGVAVYTPTPSRIIKVRLNRFAGADLSSGKIRITYTEDGLKNKVLASEEIDLR